MNNLVNKMKKELELLKPSDILKFDADVSKVPDMLKLTLGEPDFNTPDHVKQAGIKSIEDNASHYAPSAGEITLRKAASQFLDRKYNLKYNPGTEILVTVGATEAISSALGAILNKGDKVIIPTPIFPGYIPVTILNQATPIFIDTSDNGFVLSPDMLKNAIDTHGENIKAIVFNFPTNPTGVTYRKKDLIALAEVLKNHDIFVLSDEVYSELTYGDPHESIATYLPNQTLVISGVSKSHAMTGWRIGLLCGPEEIIGEIMKVHQFSITTTTTIAQRAATEAFTNGFNDPNEMKKEYEKRRDFLYKKMTELGFNCAKPEGAFYLFAKIPENLIQNSMDFCVDLANKSKLALIPGSSFGPGGEGYVRLSYAASMENLEEAMIRLENYIQLNNK